MSAGRAGRKPNPPKPAEPWYTVLARVWGVYNFPVPKPNNEPQPQTVWRHEL
ncbi:hypothetical protein UFOVP907_62 [uncultured Caudovirales phage]|uniref:Uncharacterized protein n=1 Tax=uncultured Caudovirales phage TaxID=2100421 RepID=A0A6J5PJN4_9CAUD|nr:hypothetical protein UFOVP907_62 [uncultured Caudovirales phage]